MKTKLGIIILILGMSFYACQDDFFLRSNQDDSSLIVDKSDSCKPIIIDLEQFESAIIEGYIIDTAYLIVDTLKLLVSYSGGCGNVDFNLLTHGYFMESYPVQLNVVLDINDNDPCEAFLQTSLCFDIKNLANSYNEGYQTIGGTIIIHLDGYEEALIFEF